MKNSIDVLLYSSGVDSYISYYYLTHEKGITPIPVYIDLGHRYSFIEKNVIREALPQTVIIPCKEYGLFEHYDAYIPLRNLLLCTLVSAYFENFDNINIYLGGLRDDRIVDNNKEIFKLYSKVLSKSSEKKIIVQSAFDFELSKYEIVQWFIQKFPEQQENLVSKTFSCYNPDTTKKDPHCYRCRACYRRNVSLHPIIFLPFDRHTASTYYSELLKNKEQYDKVRYESSLKYLKRVLGLSLESTDERNY